MRSSRPCTPAKECRSAAAHQAAAGSRPPYSWVCKHKAACRIYDSRRAPTRGDAGNPRRAQRAGFRKAIRIACYARKDTGVPDRSRGAAHQVPSGLLAGRGSQRTAAQNTRTSLFGVRTRLGQPVRELARDRFVGRGLAYWCTAPGGCAAARNTL